MISLSTALLLKSAGLTWLPALHDFFAIPGRGLDDQVFVISDVMAEIEVRNNLPLVTFQGTAEWALDYVMTSEVVWLPSESQLRSAVVRHLAGETPPAMLFSNLADGYRLEIRFRGESIAFENAEASEAYAAALLYLLSG
jgi:hypothetical protein